MTKPHIVLVPGSVHTPACMVPLMEKLHALGYTMHCQQMASVGNPSPPSDLSEDIRVLRRTVEEAIGQGNDVIVAPHSWGGVVTGTGLKDLSKGEREAQGLKGGVIRIAFMTSFVLPLFPLVQISPAQHPSFFTTISPTRSRSIGLRV